MLPEHLRVIRSKLAERGAGNIVVMDHSPKPTDDQFEQDLDMEVEMAGGTGPRGSQDEVTGNGELGDQRGEGLTDNIDMILDTHMRQADSTYTPSIGQSESQRNDDHPQTTDAVNLEPMSVDGSGHNTEVEPLEEPDEAGPVSDMQAEAPAASPEVIGENNDYGPIRTTSLTRAMRHNLNMLDHGRPSQGNVRAEDREVLVCEEQEVLLAEKKKGRKEVLMKDLRGSQLECLRAAKEKEWGKMLASGAVRVHKGEEAKRIVEEVGRDRVLQSRFVVTFPDDKVQKEQGVLKARWCIRGYLDPDLLTLHTSSPTLSHEGLSVVLQLLATFGWEVNIADIEAAFLRADPLKRKVLVKVPSDGIPGVGYDDVIELVKPVYGLADAPSCWHVTLRSFLLSCNMKQSELDPCIYYKHDTSGVLTGCLAVHVDDILMGGSKEFQETVMKSLKERFPFKHWVTGEGEFLGKHVKQNSDQSIEVSQKDYSMSVSCISISKERRKLKEQEINEKERSQMRALLGEVNWIAMNSRPDLSASCSLLQQRVSSAKVEDLIECNRLVGVVRDFAHGKITVLPIKPEDVEFAIWSDASWANASEKKSQGGYLLAAVSRAMRKEEWTPLSMLRWKSYKQDRQTASTLGAELLSASRAVAEGRWMRSMWCEAVFGAYTIEDDRLYTPRVPLCLLIDSKPVYDHCNSEVVTIRDKRLAIEMLLLKKEFQRDGLYLRWQPTYAMLGDVLTKMNAPKELIRNVMHYKKFCIVDNDQIRSWAARGTTKKTMDAMK